MPLTLMDRLSAVSAAFRQYAGHLSICDAVCFCTCGHEEDDHEPPAGPCDIDECQCRSLQPKPCSCGYEAAKLIVEGREP